MPFEDIENWISDPAGRKKWLSKNADTPWSTCHMGKFKNDILIRDLAEEIVVNSQITVKKYSLFRKAVLADIVAFIFAITTFVAA